MQNDRVFCCYCSGRDDGFGENGETCKVNEVILLSGCEVRAINLSNKNMKFGIFIGGTSVRSKNISAHDILPESMKYAMGSVVDSYLIDLKITSILNTAA